MMSSFKRKISTKILFLSLLACVVVFGIAVAIINTQAEKILVEDAKELLHKDARQISFEVDSFFAQKGVLVEQMATNQQVVKYMNEVRTREGVKTNPHYADVVNSLKAIQNTDSENLALVWLALDDASYLVSHDEWDCPLEWDIDSRPWYPKTLEKGDIYYTEPYIDKVTGEMVVSIIEPVYDISGSSLGVVAVDLMISDIPNIMGKYTIGESGYAVLVSRQGQTIYHKDSEKVLNFNMSEVQGKLGELTRKMIAGEEGTGEYELDGEKKFFGYAPVMSNGWSVGTLVPQSEVLSDVEHLSRYLALIFIVALIVIMAVLLIVTKKTLRHVPVLLEGIERISGGDLTVRMNINTQDEIGQIAHAVNDMGENLKNLMHTVKSSSETVHEKSSNLSGMIGQNVTASNEVAMAVEDIAQNTNEQAHNTKNGADRLIELSDNIEEVMFKTQKMHELTDATEGLGSKGLDAIKELTKSSAENSSAVENIEGIVDEVDRSSHEISTIVDTINQISEQTNLLALNASIEAARAGEAGKGFAVVADEIRKLAEQTSGATDEIKNKIENIQSISEDAVKHVQTANEIVKKSDIAVGETKEIFGRISQNINNIREQMDQVTESGFNMKDKKDNIIELIGEIASSAEDISASTEEMSASAQEQMASMEEMTSYVEELDTLSEKLKDELTRFKI